MQEPEGVDPRSLPQTTIRKVIKHCLDNGVFDTTPFIDQRPMIEYVPKRSLRCIGRRSARGGRR